jgi:hypothetical protein
MKLPLYVDFSQLLNDQKLVETCPIPLLLNPNSTEILCIVPKRITIHKSFLHFALAFVIKKGNASVAAATVTAVTILPFVKL